MPSTVTSAVTDRRLFMPRSRDSITIGEKPPTVTPDFDAFALSHPWVGQKMGKVQNLPGGFAQQFQAATVYGVFGGDPFEVHGSIRDKYVQLNGPVGPLGFPTTNETGTP